MSWGWSTDKNTSAGGHTYDRTTGTWAGETQGSVGDNSNWGAPVGAPTRVIHDANGPVGHETAASGSFVTDAGRLIETRPEVVVAGPGAAGATVGPASAASTGTGPGTGAVSTAGPARTVGPGSALVVPGFSPGRIPWKTYLSTAFSDEPDIDGVQNQPLKRIGIGGPQEAMGAISDIGWVRTNTGWVSVPSSDGKERQEDDVFQEAFWTYRNKVLPDMMIVPQPFPNFLGPQSGYRFDFWKSEWQDGGVGQGAAGGSGW